VTSGGNFRRDLPLARHDHWADEARTMFAQCVLKKLRSI
jgi:hypothetical protein